MKQDEFKVRYLVKILSSIVIAALNMIIQLLLPRAFSVEEYGYYTYNLNIFTSVVTMAVLAAPNALVSKFSKRNDEIGLVLFYLKFFICVAALLNMAVFALQATGYLSSVFKGQDFLVVLLGLECAALLRIQTDCVSMFDAMAISRFPAVMQVLLKAALSALAVGGYFAGRLDLIFFYATQAVIVFIVTAYMLFAILKEQRRRYPKRADHGSLCYIHEYYDFCRPLVLSNIVSQLVVIFMNWVLMEWGGAPGQAMFGAAWQLNTLVSYVFAPYAELSKREFAVISNDLEAVRHRYMQSLRIMMWLTSYFAVFIAFLSDWMLPVVYGAKYAKATAVTAIIMFYTVYQAWGQVAGSFLLALEKTKISAALGIFGQLVTLALVFLFQVPNLFWPNGLGEVGIALTYLVSNLISVAFSLFINARILRISFWGSLSIQIPPLLLCSVSAFLLKNGINRLVAGDVAWVSLAKTMAAGIAYTLFIGFALWHRPQLAGLGKESLRAVFRHKR